MIHLGHHFKGTYAKNLLADWPLLTELIQKDVAWIKDTGPAQNETSGIVASALLKDYQIDDALNGPFQYLFHTHMAAYSAIVKAEAALTLMKDEIFKDSEHEIDITLGLPEHLLNEIDFATLGQMRDQLHETLKMQHTELETHILTWIDQLLAEFSKNGLNLSDLEIQEFRSNQPLPELNDRFVNFKVTLPNLSQSPFDFQQYFTLKITLAIHSALSRMQKSNTSGDVAQALGAFHSTLKTLSKTEGKLIKTHKKAVAELITKVQQPP